MSRIFILKVLLIYSVESVFAQKDTLKGIIPIMQVLGEREKYSTVGMYSLNFDSLTIEKYQNQTLTELLSNESPIFIKVYAPGQLASITMRGGSASQTALLWNGININSPTLGMHDLSIIPIDALDEVKVDFGTQAPLWGSGAISGSIQVNSRPRFNQGYIINLNSMVGSFLNLRNSISANWSNNNWSLKTKLGRMSGINDFPYINRTQNNEIQRQVNSDFVSTYVTQDVFFKSKKNLILGFNFWFLQSDRGIAPTMNSLNNNQRQEDRNLRMSLFMEQNFDKFSWRVRQAFLLDYMEYVDSISKIRSITEVQSFISEIEFNYTISKYLRIWSGVNFTQNEAIGSGLVDEASQRRLAWVNSLNYISSNKKFSTVLSLRAEEVSDVKVPLLPSLALDWKILNNLKIYSSVARHFRIPTINDLFWANGGNPNLKPENGFAAELGISSDFKFSKTKITTNINTFYRNINDWIQWTPTGNIWTPENIMQVESIGTEFFINGQFEINKVDVKLGGFYSYTSSQNAHTSKQLIYVPFEKGGGNVALGYKNHSIRYNHQITGFTFISTDNHFWLPSFHTADLYISSRITFHQFSISPNFSVLNLWNHNYEIVFLRPMPGRFYQLGVQFQFIKPNKNKQS